MRMRNTSTAHDRSMPPCDRSAHEVGAKATPAQAPSTPATRSRPVAQPHGFLTRLAPTISGCTVVMLERALLFGTEARAWIDRSAWRWPGAAVVRPLADTSLAAQDFSRDPPRTGDRAVDRR